MDALSIGDLISGGSTLTLAYIVWTEVRLMRAVLESMNKRLSILEERTRIASNTPALGVQIVEDEKV